MADLLATGSNALIAFQRALSTVSHNVANINTPGYSRQRAEFAASNPTLLGNSYQGNGVQIADVRRMADSLATSRLLDSTGELARLQQLSSLSNRIDSLFSDKATGLAGSWSSFFDSVSALSANAAGQAERADVLAQAQALAARFRQLDAQLDTLATEVDSGLAAGADEINRLTAEIAALNGRIGANASHPSNDLLDRRDLLIGELVALTGGNAAVQDDGLVNVFSAGGQALVVGTSAARVITVADAYRPERTQLALEQHGHTTLLDARALGGRMGGLLEFRQQVLDPALSELGRIAVALADTFNTAHAAGIDEYGQRGGAFFDVAGPRINAHAGNAGTATFQARVADLGGLDGHSILLRFDGGGWVATRADTGASVAVSGTGTGTAADPLRVGGVELVLTSTSPEPNDRFLLQPAAGAAGDLRVAIGDPARIAAATAVHASASLGNAGSGRVVGLAVTQPTHADLATPVAVSFIDASQYTLGGAGPFAYTAGQAISHNGWSLTLDGVPSAGDSFDVAPRGPGSSDNGNVLVLANLDDAKRLNAGTASLNGAVGGLTTSVGARARQAEQSLQAQQVLQDQAVAARESIAGVNLDEEAADLMRLQQAYQAAAQIISTADLVFQSLLSAVRR